MPDNFRGFTTSPMGPASKHVTLAPGGVLAEADRPWWIFCNGTGAITLVDELGQSVPYAMVSGQVLPFCPVQIAAITGGPFIGWR